MSDVTHMTFCPVVIAVIRDVGGFFSCPSFSWSAYVPHSLLLMLLVSVFEEAESVFSITSISVAK